MTKSDQQHDGPRMDAIRFEVIRSAFSAATDEMAATLRKSAYSTNIKTRADYSCALYNSNLQILAQSFSQPIHLASMTRMVPNAINLYGADRLRAGDAIAFNDSHQGCMHLNDIVVIAPIYRKDKLIGYAASVAHHVDIGGIAPGGVCVSTDIYQEGVIIPPTRLVHEGKIVSDVFNLIVANIRSPKQMAGDFRAQVAAAKVGELRVAEIIDRFGVGTVSEFTDELIRYTQRWTRSEILKLPEGAYQAECFMDDDGVSDTPIKIALKATIANGRVSFDLAGSDEQRPSPMNANLTYAYSSLAYVIKCLIDPEITPNHGFYEQLDVSAPRGTIFNPNPPAGVVGGNELSVRLMDLGFRAFAEAIPDKICACGKSIICSMGCGGFDPRTGEYYTFMETIAGGYGGRLGKDGMDAVQAHGQNTENSPVEETEHNYPIMIRRYELINDSDGAGKFRGGLGIRRDWVFPDHQATYSFISDGRCFPPWGLFGGEPGQVAEYVLEPDGEARQLSSKFTVVLNPGATARVCTPGGGGYGPPHERDPEAVLRDVIDGKVSTERARDVYGVELDLANRRVDKESTAKLREAMKQVGCQQSVSSP